MPRVMELISIDGGMEHVVNRAVGSCRMKVTIRAQGGHSYENFGNTNAIVHMARLIARLYEKQPPRSAKTTYNVGVIEGGTTVNSICGECSILYEYRSESRECLQEMEDFAIYAKGATPNGPYKNGPGEIGTVICVGGIVVHPGDIVVGDQDGVVVIRPEDAEEIAKAAHGVVEKEAKIAELIATGSYVRPWVDAKLEEIGCEYIEL